MDYNEQILQAKLAWERAFRDGDEAGMSNAHNMAEHARQAAKDAGMYDSIMSYLQNGDAADYNTAINQYNDYLGESRYEPIEQKARPVYEPPVQEDYQYQYAMEAPSADYGNYSEPSADYSAPSELSEKRNDQSWLNGPMSEIVSESVSSAPSYEDISKVWGKDDASDELPKLGDFLSDLYNRLLKPFSGFRSGKW